LNLALNFLLCNEEVLREVSQDLFSQSPRAFEEFEKSVISLDSSFGDRFNRIRADLLVTA
jgi:hypothetical protein